MGFCDRMEKKAQPLWKRIFNHPFIQGIGDGTLSEEKFKFYIRQDYVFLMEYSKTLALAVTKPSDPLIMGKFAEILNSTLNVEMALHRNYCEKFGILREELEITSPAPTNYAYTRHLLSVAFLGTLAEFIAALIPCQWSYYEIGKMLSRKTESLENQLYAEWINMYSSEEYAQIVQWLIGLIDRLADNAKRSEIARMDKNYIMSARYEFLFWEMAFNQESWPI